MIDQYSPLFKNKRRGKRGLNRKRKLNNIPLKREMGINKQGDLIEGLWCINSEASTANEISILGYQN